MLKIIGDKEGRRTNNGNPSIMGSSFVRIRGDYRAAFRDVILISGSYGYSLSAFTNRARASSAPEVHEVPSLRKSRCLRSALTRLSLTSAVRAPGRRTLWTPG